METATKPKTVRVSPRPPRKSGLAPDLPSRLREEAEESAREAFPRPAAKPKRERLPTIVRTPWGALLLRLRCWRRAAEGGYLDFIRASREVRKERDATCAACAWRREKPGCPRVRCRLKGCGCDDFHTALLSAKCPKKAWAR